MRLHELERMLSRIPQHPAPKVELEQYVTPAEVAAPLLFEAWTLGDVDGKSVVDLGAGTGMLAIGASLLGADEVVAVEIDASAAAAGREAAASAGARVTFVEADVRSWSGRADTVVMNPPFGAQVENADRAFLDAAFATAHVVYSLHNAKTREFVERYAAERAFSVTHRWLLRVRLSHQYAHQSRAGVDIDVIAFRFTKTL
jgi:putative methylase